MPSVVRGVWLSHATCCGALNGAQC
jgi:hypothetical protein